MVAVESVVLASREIATKVSTRFRASLYVRENRNECCRIFNIYFSASFFEKH